MNKPNKEYILKLIENPNLNIFDYIRYQNIILLLKKAQKLAENKHNTGISSSFDAEKLQGVVIPPKTTKM